MNDMLRLVQAKAVKDPAFRAALLQDAKSVLEKSLKVKLPADLKVKVVEDNASTVHLVLPAGAEMSEADLGKVAGGFGGFNCNAQSTVTGGPSGPPSQQQVEEFMNWK